MWRTTLLIFLNVSIMVTAQQINLCGIVINQSGTPVKGLVVKLINNQLSDTTNAKGKFLLQEKNQLMLLMKVKRLEFIGLTF